ncbi:MAG: endonuclease/exonuclease/phosphatase family protein [Acidobacteriota bacterium]
MKRVFTLILALTLGVSISWAPASLGQSQTFARIAAWNQQGVRFTGQGQAIPVNKPEQLRTAIAAINPDVIALSEVNSPASMDEIVATPFSNGATYKVSMDGSQPGLLQIAVLFKDSPDISITNRRAISGSDDNNSALRKAYAFDGKIRNFDFLLIAVHLKSGRTNANRKTRNSQTKAIASFIRTETANTNEKDVLVVGDYNMIPGQDAVNFSNLSPGSASNEFLRFISSTLSGPSHIDTCVNASIFKGNLLDGFSISRVQTTEWTGFIRIQQLQALLPNMFCDKYKRTFSDHLPLVARFRVSSPDDD